MYIFQRCPLRGPGFHCIFNVSLENSSYTLEFIKEYSSLTFDLQHGREVRPLLPVGEEDVAARKNPLWKTLFEGFNKFDGIPTPMEQKVFYFICVL